MTPVWNQILDVLRRQGTDRSPRILEPSTFNSIVAAFIDAFVDEPQSTFWWASLKRPPRASCVYAESDGFAELALLLQQANAREPLILLVTDESPDPVGGLVGSWEEIQGVLEEVMAFEFALTDKTFRWAIFDTHHNALLLVDGRPDQPSNRT